MVRKSVHDKGQSMHILVSRRCGSLRSSFLRPSSARMLVSERELCGARLTQSCHWVPVSQLVYLPYPVVLSGSQHSFFNAIAAHERQAYLQPAICSGQTRNDSLKAFLGESSLHGNSWVTSLSQFTFARGSAQGQGGFWCAHEGEMVCTPVPTLSLLRTKGSQTECKRKPAVIRASRALKGQPLKLLLS